MNLRKLSFVLCIGLLLFGCGKQEKNTAMTESRQIAAHTFMEDGFIYSNTNPPRKGKAEYYDYQTGIFMPLCDQANCLHDSQECTAVHLGNASTIGRLGDRWYYLMFSETDSVPAFYSCDLNGQNEKKIGLFPHSQTGPSLYFDNSCVMVINDVESDDQKKSNLVVLKWMTFEMDIDFSVFEQAVNEKMEEKNLPYEIEIVNFPADYEKDYRSNLNAYMSAVEEEQADLVNCFGTLGAYDSYAMLLQKGLLEPLDPYMEETETGKRLYDSYPAPVWETLKDGGSV